MDRRYLKALVRLAWLISLAFMVIGALKSIHFGCNLAFDPTVHDAVQLVVWGAVCILCCCLVLATGKKLETMEKNDGAK